MDGENNGKPYEQMDDLGVPLFLETPKSTKTCNSLMDCVPQVPQFLPVAIWPLVEATLHVSPGQSSMVAVIQYFHPAVVHVVLFAVALRYFTIWWITFWSTIPSEDVQWTCVALVSSSSMFMGWLSIGVFVSSEVSRREATTKLFFGFPHDCPSKLRVMPLCGSFGARKAWEDKNLQHAPNYLFFFPHIHALFFVLFSKSNLQGQVHRPQPRMSNQVVVRTWYVWTCSSVPSAAHLAVRTTLQACAGRVVTLQHKFSWKVTQLILATSSFLRRFESFWDV